MLKIIFLLVLFHLYDEFNTSIACTGSDEGKPCIDLFAYKGSYRTPTNGARILINGGVENDSSITIAADKIGFFGVPSAARQEVVSEGNLAYDIYQVLQALHNLGLINYIDKS